MLSGILFDIKEFAVHDGPGVRTTYFLKGCPLRCRWCHNPEGISPRPQPMKSSTGERTVGTSFTSAELAARIQSQAELYRAGEGGVTFSGGEPLAQAAFLAETLDQFQSIHVLLDTSGYAAEFDFQSLLARVQMVYFDLKLIDPISHAQFTGVDNGPIHRNLRLLSGSSLPYHIRIPLIPGVTDTDANLTGIARHLAALPRPPQSVDLLLYNKAAGGKYAACGLSFNPGYDETREVNAALCPFQTLGLNARVL